VYRADTAGQYEYGSGDEDAALEEEEALRMQKAEVRLHPKVHKLLDYIGLDLLLAVVQWGAVH
jgi:hypothetical protein